MASRDTSIQLRMDRSDKHIVSMCSSAILRSVSTDLPAATFICAQCLLYGYRASARKSFLNITERSLAQKKKNPQLTGASCWTWQGARTGKKQVCVFQKGSNCNYSNCKVDFVSHCGSRPSQNGAPRRSLKQILHKNRVENSASTANRSLSRAAQHVVPAAKVRPTAMHGPIITSDQQPPPSFLWKLF